MRVGDPRQQRGVRHAVDDFFVGRAEGRKGAGEAGLAGDDEIIGTKAEAAGGWAGDKVNAFTGVGLTDTQRMAQQLVSRLLNWRKTASAIHQGKLLHFAPDRGTFLRSLWRASLAQTISEASHQTIIRKPN